MLFTHAEQSMLDINSRQNDLYPPTNLNCNECQYAPAGCSITRICSKLDQPKYHGIFSRGAE